VEQLVRQQVARGAYPNASALIGEAVHLLLDVDRAEARLESLIQEGVESGPAVELSAQSWKKLRKEVHTLHATRKKGE
jgi:putative addiction module CopG family antidote